MRSNGMWRTINREKVPISELEDSHLINVIKHVRERIIKNPTKYSQSLEQRLEIFEDLIAEATSRQLKWNYTDPAPDPQAFKGRPLQKRPKNKPAAPSGVRVRRNIVI